MKYLSIILLLMSLSVYSQENKATLQREARKFAREGNELFSQNNFTDAEVAYKKALEKDPNYDIANYNLGVALSEQNRDKEAIAQYEITAKMSEDKMTKSEAYHNIGNQHYDTKNYQGAVDAYKNSLRSNPNDDETRYNLALAQEMLEDQQSKDDENKDDKDNKDKQDQNKDKQDQQDKDKKEDGEDQKNKDENEGDKDDQKQDPKDQNKDQENKEQQKPKPGQLSPQQVEQLLEAMNNEEKKTQEKMNARKEKGAKVKQEKDW